ncbi:MAG: glycogen/starch synthase, partial [Desulfovibrio sp.]|nr:glycogen/starch synthase [Desulfovibrio sp.]
MRILMFGWEFPPHISGGLGTACYGMTQALAKMGAEIIFVLPRVKGGDGNNFLRLVSASGTPITREEASRIFLAGQDIWRESVRFLTLDSPIFPYSTPEEYAEAVRWLRRAPGRQYEEVRSSAGDSFTYDIQGGYGPDLMSEVRRYSRLAAALALRESFDVIHV